MKENNSYDNKSLLDELTKLDFYAFLIRSFYTINPGIKFIQNWHINFICEILNNIIEGKIKRLIINIPPRSLKSVIISASFPAWILAKEPSKRIIVASYNQNIGIRQANDTRMIMQSDWYKELFPNSRIIKGENQKHKFGTKFNGYRFTTSINGTLTGEGGDILILDDPCNPVKINSKKYRESIIDWYQRVFSSRLNNKKDGVIILVMQRLHKEDLSGYLLENFKEEWNHLKIETIAEKDCIFYNEKRIKFRRKDEILSNDSKELIERLRKNLGEFNFNAQYQQNPSSFSNIIKESWISLYDKKNTNIDSDVYISIDCASSINSKSDYTAIGVFKIQENNVYLIEMNKIKLEYNNMKKYSINKINEFKPAKVIIEDKSVGISLINELKLKFENIIAKKVNLSKEIRLMQVLNIFEEKRFFIPKDEDEKLKDFIYELTNFPNAEHDDQVDSLVQFLLFYQQNNLSKTTNNKQKNIMFI